MIGLLAEWCAIFAVLLIFVVGGPRQGGALTLAYFLGLSLIHVPGCLAYLNVPPGSFDYQFTSSGFELTLLGMVAFVAGGILVKTLNSGDVVQHVWSDADAIGRLGLRMIIAGVLAYFVLMPVASYIPSLIAIVSSMATMLILGLWLRLYSAAIAGRPWRTITTLMILPLLPLGTLVAGGFIGFGVNWVLSVVSFFYVISRKRIWFYIATPFVLFLGLSLFVTYMGQRTGIREVVWIQNANLFDRLDRVSTLVTDFQLLDINAQEHTDALDARLNQNFLVGAGISRHEAGLSDYLYGESLPLWIFVPRVLWADKPGVGGSGTFVSDFTGIHFDQTTSVGIGQVLEFYMNFGTIGVIFGFLVLGGLLMWLDVRTMRALARGDTRGLVLSALPGLTLLLPGGSLMEMLIAMIGATVGANALLYFGFFQAQVLPQSKGCNVASGQRVIRP